MTITNGNSPRTVEIGAAVAVFADGGEEWSVFDEPRLQSTPGEWEGLADCECQPIDFAGLALELTGTREIGVNKAAHTAPYRLHASGQFLAQLKELYAAGGAKGRAAILSTLQETCEQLRTDPVADSRFEFDLPDLPRQVRSAWPLPLVIHYAIDAGNQLVFLHSAKISQRLIHE